MDGRVIERSKREYVLILGEKKGEMSKMENMRA